MLARIHDHVDFCPRQRDSTDTREKRCRSSPQKRPLRPRTSFFHHPSLSLIHHSSDLQTIQDATRQQDYSNRWIQLNTETKNGIKQQALKTLASPSQKAGNFASQVVAAIAAVELPHNQWADLIELLLSFVNNQENTNLKIATLQTIGFICEVIVCLNTFISLVILTNASFFCSFSETGNPQSTFKRNFDRCYSRREEGGTIVRRSTCCCPRSLQLARVRS